MVRVITHSRRTAAALLTGLVIAFAAVGCGVLAPGASEADVRELVGTAVMAANPAVVAIPEITTGINGLGRDMLVSLVIDRGPVLSVGELRTISAAVWASSPFRPNAIRFLATRPDGAAIDLAPAAEVLMPGAWARFGDRGVTLIGMSDVFGEQPPGDRGGLQ